MGEGELMNSLNGKIALVTGGGRGIGRTCAIALAEAGADVAVCSRTAGEINEVADDIRVIGRKSLAVVCDVTDAAQVRRMADEVTGQVFACGAFLGRSWARWLGIV